MLKTALSSPPRSTALRLAALLSLGLVVSACSGGAPARTASATVEAQAVVCRVWSASAVYVGGDTVTQGTQAYRANWWTQGNDPATNNGVSGSGQTWTKVSSCGVNPPPPPPPPPPTSPTGLLTTGSTYAFQVLTPGFTDRFLRHSGALGVTEVVSASSADALKLDANWKIVAGLADAACYSFESVGSAGQYLRHQGSRVRIDPLNASDSLFKNDATFCARAALDGTVGGVSLEAKNQPGSYIRHKNAELWIDPSAGAPSGYNQDASWRAVTPFTTSVNPPPPPPPTPPSPPPPPQSGFKKVAYFPQWAIYGRNYQVKNIDTSGTASGLTHINYAFGNLYDKGGSFQCDIVTRAESGNGDGGDGYADYGKSFDAASSVSGVGDVYDQNLKGNFNQLKQLKAKYPNLKNLISLGGWTWSRHFSAASSTDAGRKALVSSCINVYIKGDLPISDGAGGPGAAAGVFDGIDIDWEYPGGGGLAYNSVSPGDKQNFTLLLQEFRRQLDAVRPGLLLTIAAPGGADKIANQEPAAYNSAVDWINIMTYDFRGAFDAAGPSNFHSNLYPSPNDPGSGVVKNYAVDTAVQAFLNAGIPASKLVIGIPFYGRGWTGVAGGNNGLYQSAAGGARGTYDAGIEDYKVLKNAPGSVYRDPLTKQMWKYDGSTFWSYDDPEVIATKVAYIKAKGLGGAMAWSLDGDDAQGTLAKAINAGLR